jgi:hypothetical protein
MDAKTLAKIVQIVVQEEVSKIVKKELGAMRKQIVSEIKNSILKQLVAEKTISADNTIFESDNYFDIPNVLPERNRPIKKQITKDPIINDILNETVAFGHSSEYDEYPTIGNKTITNNSAQGMSSISNFRSMMDAEMGMSHGNQKGNLTIQEMMPKTNTEGLPTRNQEVPDAVAKALTRDYTALVKAMNKK